MSLTSLVITASESNGDSVPPWVVGAVALGILLTLMGVLLIVGGGREHS